MHIYLGEGRIDRQAWSLEESEKSLVEQLKKAEDMKSRRIPELRRKLHAVRWAMENKGLKSQKVGSS